MFCFLFNGNFVLKGKVQESTSEQFLIKMKDRVIVSFQVKYGLLIIKKNQN